MGDRINPEIWIQCFRVRKESRPVVRAMGLLCLAQLNAEKYRALLSPHTTDKESVYLSQGCIGSTITVGEFAERLLKNPFFLSAPDHLLEKSSRM
jgi:hypothetical protein